MRFGFSVREIFDEAVLFFACDSIRLRFFVRVYKNSFKICENIKFRPFFGVGFLLVSTESRRRRMIEKSIRKSEGEQLTNRLLSNFLRVYISLIFFPPVFFQIM